MPASFLRRIYPRIPPAQSIDGIISMYETDYMYHFGFDPNLELNIEMSFYDWFFFRENYLLDVS